MVSEYFLKKTATEKFDNDLRWSIGEIRDKKIILYGAGKCFDALDKKYHLKELNIVAIADKKFREEGVYEGMRAISPENIRKEDYDVILITNEYSEEILTSLACIFNIKNKDIRTVFNETIDEEYFSFNYLSSFGFEEHLQKLNKKLSGKTVLIYGAGVFFEAIREYYDISGLNIVGICDKKFSTHDKNQEFSGYKVYSPSEIKDLNPDYVLVATKYYINIIAGLSEGLLKNTKIKVKPLLRKPFLTLLKEIWE